MTKQYDLNIFDVLKHANNKDYDYFSKLSDKEKEAFQPWLAMRFMSSSPDGIDAMQSILMTHYVLNNNFQEISKDKDLFYKLMCVVGDGSFKKHSMIKPPSGKHISPMITELISELNGETLSDIEAYIYITKNDIELMDLKELAEDLDWDSDKIKNLKKAHVSFMNEYGN